MRHLARYKKAGLYCPAYLELTHTDNSVVTVVTTTSVVMRVVDPRIIIRDEFADGPVIVIEMIGAGLISLATLMTHSSTERFATFRASSYAHASLPFFAITSVVYAFAA
jgi:hypothetical protein